MKKIQFSQVKIGILAFCLISAISCKNEDLVAIDQTAKASDIANCTDGIMNGDETGVDCGGACNACEEGVELGRRAELYVTNNADGNINIYSVTGDSVITLSTSSTAAEGIFYSKEDDIVVQASRSDLRLDAYSGLSMLTSNTNVDAAFSSAADLESPRELAVRGSTYVVSDNGSNIFFVYTKDGNSFTLASTVEIPFPVWGITFKGKDLYAVVDKSSDLAVFYDFEASISYPDCRLYPSKRVTIEGIVRTHGLTYNGADDVMVLTDIGDAANTTDDGGFHIINKFTEKMDALSDGQLMPMWSQFRVAGPATLLGNPIDVAYDSETDSYYISEVGNGKVLGFTNCGNGGNIAPSFIKDLPAASSIYFSSDETDGDIGNETGGQRTELYATSTANGDITVYDGNCSVLKTVTSSSTSSEGIFYTGWDDALIQASRSDLVLEYYKNFSATNDGDTVDADFRSTVDLMSPREIAVRGNTIVVADNGENIFYVYTYNGASFTLINTLQTTCSLWGITFKGDDLLAVVDKTNKLAVFENFLSNTVDGTVYQDKVIAIEGIVRTHGIDYSESGDVLVMTDIGDAANAADDGAFHVIQGFHDKLMASDNGSSISLNDQIRVSGPSTVMGNPIDVAYDHKTKTVFIAEVGNGKVLSFTNALNISGDVSPNLWADLAKASSIYLYNN